MIKNIEYDDYWKIWTEFYINSIFNKVRAESKNQDGIAEGLSNYYYSNETLVPN
jgi:hypothetical protein